MTLEQIRSLPLARAVAIGLGLMVSHAAVAQVPIVQPSQQLRPPVAPASATQTQFGWEAATDGETTIVTVNQGQAAYAYTKNAQGRWRLRDTLVVPAGYTAYGAAVLGNVALLQGVVDSQNVVFVFKRTLGQWSHTQTLPAAQPSAFTNVALGPDYAAIADAGANEVAGAVFAYDKVGAGTYSFATELVPAGATEGWLSGYSITNEGNTLLSSAPGSYVVAAFVKSGGVWSEEAQLTHPGGFGTDPRASYSADRALLTSMTRSIDSPNNPVVFRRQNGSWSIEQALVHPDDPDHGLRTPTALKDNLLVAREDGIAGEAHLFVYELIGGTWTATAQLSKPVCADEFSNITSEVTIAGRTVFVTCPTVVTPHPAFDGRVFVYNIP